MSDQNTELPLGKKVPSPRKYSPESLVAISRSAQRQTIGFNLHKSQITGYDTWDCFELTWLNSQSIPQVAELLITIPANTDKTVESKSLKLYLNSLAFAVFDSRDDILHTIRTDLEKTLSCTLSLKLVQPGMINPRSYDADYGVLDNLVDRLPTEFVTHFAHDAQPQPELLIRDTSADSRIKFVMRSFYCLCPITSQPDQATILIDYIGSNIQPSRLFAYLISFRSCRAFHETTIERIFIDLLLCLQPHSLKVEGRFNRRGGIAINPLRGLQKAQH